MKGEQKEENVLLLLLISNNATDTLFPSLKKLTQRKKQIFLFKFVCFLYTL